jgi:hypothetical protein
MPRHIPPTHPSSPPKNRPCGRSAAMQPCVSNLPPWPHLRTTVFGRKHGGRRCSRATACAVAAARTATARAAELRCKRAGLPGPERCVSDGWVSHSTRRLRRIESVAVAHAPGHFLQRHHERLQHIWQARPPGVDVSAARKLQGKEKCARRADCQAMRLLDIQ